MWRRPGASLPFRIGGCSVERSTRTRGDRYARARRRMVERIADGGVRDERVLAALNAVPRHQLLPQALEHRAYQIEALPIGEGQTISAPDIVASMSEALELEGHETVLEIGTGSAYQAAVLSQLAERVISIEVIPGLGWGWIPHIRMAAWLFVKRRRGLRVVLRRKGGGLPRRRVLGAFSRTQQLPLQTC